MTRHEICCSCGHAALRSIDGSYKLVNRIVVFKSVTSFGVVICKGCGKEVEVPVRLEIPSEKPAALPPLFVPKGPSTEGD